MSKLFKAEYRGTFKFEMSYAYHELCSYPIFVYLWRHQYNESGQKQGYSHAHNSDLKITGIILGAKNPLAI